MAELQRKAGEALTARAAAEGTQETLRARALCPTVICNGPNAQSVECFLSQSHV